MKLSLSCQFWAWIALGVVGASVGLCALDQYCESAIASWSRSVLCELKLTDIAIAFFTYCLVVVGWFTIRSNEQTVKNLERAYLAVGPTALFTRMLPTPNVSLKLNIHNTGRTGATITTIFGEFSRAPPIGDKPQYGNGRLERTDLSIAAGTDTVLDAYVFEDDFTGEQSFWGYVLYRDIFKRTHTARFCVRLYPAAPAVGVGGQFQIAGGDAWRECE